MKKKSSSANKRPFTVLLDQNVPPPVADWLRALRPQWLVQHTSEVGLSRRDDDAIYRWAYRRQAVIVTYDEDFADKRFFSTKKHPGVVRLRVWPTTIEETQDALARLLKEVPDTELSGALIIIDPNHIRIRPGNLKI